MSACNIGLLGGVRLLLGRGAAEACVSVHLSVYLIMHSTEFINYITTAFCITRVNFPSTPPSSMHDDYEQEQEQGHKDDCNFVFDFDFGHHLCSRVPRGVLSSGSHLRGL